MLTKTNPGEARRLLKLAEQDAQERWHFYEQLAAMDFSGARDQPGSEHQ
jgi:hypothetical protein